MAAVRIGATKPPRLPHIFIMADSDAEKFCVRSLQAAHQVEVAKRLQPIAPERRATARMLAAVCAPRVSSSAEHVMPKHAVSRRPRRLPNLATARSENQPPRGAITITVRKGAAPHSPPCFTVMPRARTR